MGTLFWATWGRSKCNHKGPCKREAGRLDGTAMWGWKKRTEKMVWGGLQTKECGQHLEARKGDRFSSRGSRRHQPVETFILDRWDFWPPNWKNKCGPVSQQDHSNLLLQQLEVVQGVDESLGTVLVWQTALAPNIVLVQIRQLPRF